MGCAVRRGQRRKVRKVPDHIGVDEKAICLDMHDPYTAAVNTWALKENLRQLRTYGHYLLVPDSLITG